MKDRFRHARRMLVNKTPAPQKRVNANKWYRIENLVDRPSAAAIYIYDVIGCSCWWDDECRCLTAKNFIDEVNALRVDELHIHINSPGGEVDDGIAIYNTLRNHRARKTTFIDSLAASAASFIALAADEVVIALTGQVMIHDASTIAIGDADELRQTADLLDRYSNNIAGVYSRKSGMSIEECRDLMKAETWFTGAEAVEAGLADRTDEDTDEEEGDEDMQKRMTARHNLSLFAFRYAGREKAPAPALTNHIEPEPEVVPEVVAAPEPTVPVDAVEPEPEPVADVEPAEAVEGSPGDVVVPVVTTDSPISEAQEPAAEVVSEAAAEVEPEPVVEPAADVPVVDPDPVPADAAPEPEPVTATAAADSWAQLVSPLLSATPAPSTWDDAFSTLKALKGA